MSKAQNVFYKVAASKKNKLSDLKAAVAGAASGIAGTMIIRPLDMIVDIKALGGDLAWPKPKATYWGTTKNIYKTHGLKGFYAGSVGKVLKIAPQMGITFLVYKKVSDYLDKKTFKPRVPLVIKKNK